MEKEQFAAVPGFRRNLTDALVGNFEVVLRGVPKSQKKAWTRGFISALYTIEANRQAPSFYRHTDTQEIQSQIDIAIRQIEQSFKDAKLHLGERAELVELARIRPYLHSD